MQNLALNQRANVSVEAVALGDKDGEAELYIVEGTETGCNSLRPPRVKQSTRVLKIAVRTLDSYAQERRWPRVDFIKIDAEGAELSVLEGAAQMLERRPRPVILCEVQDFRTEPWNYRAKEIVSCLARQGFRWHRILEDGALAPASLEEEKFAANLVAVPEERAEEVSARLS